MKRVRSITIAVAMPFALSACYSYMPAQLETIPSGQEVRMVVTREGRLDLPEAIEPEGPFISGKVVRRDGDRLFLSIPIAQQQRGFYVSQIAQEVSLRTGEIVQIELRKLDGVKTGLFVAGTAAAAAGIVFAIIEAASRSNDDGLPPIEEFR
ncbi:MAG: hypothetical protein WEE89_16470, partial [Gemmatimonadota bacterium]